MQIQIPTIGTNYTLSAPWAFTLYSEYRNFGFIEKLTDAGYKLVTAKDRWAVEPVGLVTLPKGAELKVSRIYIRSGKSEFDSITFHVAFLPNAGTGKKLKARFWAKLSDVNRMQVVGVQETVMPASILPNIAIKFGNTKRELDL